MTERTGVRPAAVAGAFYPGQTATLATTVDQALAHVTPPPSAAHPPKALIVPHAGYVYSGPVAASAYARLLPWRDRYRRVVLLGPAHRVPVRSMAVSGASAWTTPLGSVPIDDTARDLIAALPGVVVDDAPHADEHSLEVQVPFLQQVLDSFTLVPIVVGGGGPEPVADVLDVLWGGPETLIVISTDLSHYLDYETARQRDATTIAAILEQRGDALGPHDACGAYPVKGMLEAARRHGLVIEQLDARSSGDTAGPRDRVVGYASFALHEADPGSGAGPDDRVEHLDPATRRHLLAVAVEAIRARLEHRTPATVPGATAEVLDPGASFVTLRDGSRLLGCIGTIVPNRALAEDVADNAVGAAFRDPRLPPLTDDEFGRMSVHISVLTPLEPLAVGSIAALRAAIRPEVDGLLIEAGSRRGTFLPSVWEQLPDVDDFLEHLWQKAGLRPGSWPRNLQVSRYRSIEWGEDGPRTPIRR